MLCIAPRAAAQSTGGRIRGTVTDTSGAAVSGANLALIDEATNVTRSTVSGSNGEYIFLEIPVGTYDLNVTQQGFKRYERKGVAIDLNEVVRPGHPAANRRLHGNRGSNWLRPHRGYHLDAARRGCE